MDRDEKLRIDYEQTIQYHHKLSDSRFTLLAFLPVMAGAAISFFGGAASGEQTLAIGILGFLVTLGITIYDQRNTQIYDAMQKRAKTIEALLGFEPLDKSKRGCGGAFLDRPDRSRRLFGFLLIWHDRALAVIYGATFAAWTYLMVAGFLRLAGFGSGVLLTCLQFFFPLVVFTLFVIELQRFDDPTDTQNSLSPEIRKLVFQPETVADGVPKNKVIPNVGTKK